jgi:hypothetical protein
MRSRGSILARKRGRGGAAGEIEDEKVASFGEAFGENGGTITTSGKASDGLGPNRTLSVVQGSSS